MTIDWIRFTPSTSLAAGMLIGVAAALPVLFNGRIAGIRGILGGLLPPARGDTAFLDLAGAWMVAGMGLFALCERMRAP